MRKNSRSKRLFAFTKRNIIVIVNSSNILQLPFQNYENYAKKIIQLCKIILQRMRNTKYTAQERRERNTMKIKEAGNETFHCRRI